MPIGKVEVLASGQSLTNSFVYTAKATTRNFAATSITIENVSPGSGVQYTLRGYPMEGFPPVRSIASGTVLTSGSIEILQLTDVYDQIDVGLKALQTDRSGIANVYVGRRRH